jgi:hypothetical protein
MFHYISYMVGCDLNWMNAPQWNFRIALSIFKATFIL